jgi:hypothetical protein
MESQVKYDELLTKNEHLLLHREMLPFVGQDFDKHKILIISESHFVPKGINKQLDDNWYKNNNEDFLKKTLEKNTFSRDVIALVSSGKGHVIFQNLQNGLKTANNDLKLSHVAWYNFYQKPASFGKSIKPTPLDKDVAISVFETILDTLKPKLVIFVSALSFNELKKFRKWNSEINGHKYKSYNIPMAIVPHPSSIWWNAKSKVHQNRTGKEKFVDIIQSHL